MGFFSFDDTGIAHRLENYALLHNLPASALRKLLAESEQIKLAPNDILFRDQTPCEYIYFVLDGHLDGIDTGTQRRIDSFFPGDLIGIIDLLSGDTYGILTKATRQTELLKISAVSFLAFFEQYPTVSMQLSYAIARKLRHATVTEGAPNKKYLYRDIGIISLFSDISLTKLKEDFSPLAEYDHIKLYDEEQFSTSDMDVRSFFYEANERPQTSLFFTEYKPNDRWCNAVFDHADYFYIITKENHWDELDSELIENLRGRPADIVIMHPTKGPYKNTAKFYTRYPFKRHHHITNTLPAYHRLYRFMTGQAIGLVLSGGGFRAFAHYGLIKALHESNLPIDYICGSSLGASTGALLAQNHDWSSFDKISRHCVKTLRAIPLFQNITLPFVSILNGKVITKLMQSLYGTDHIEDLPINFFCVVTNLSKNQKELKLIGPLFEWLRASVAIPAILPPMVYEDSLYVDGGVCSNMPVQDLRTILDDAGFIIALNLELTAFGQEKFSFPPVLTFKNLLLNRLGLLRKKYTMPKISDVVLGSMCINQAMYDIEGAKKADIIIAPDLKGVTFYTARKDDSLMMSGYEFAKKILNEKKHLYERWIIRD